MKKVDPHFVYFLILSVIQPASIEEIETSVATLLGPEYVDILVKSGRLRWAHEDAIKNKALIEVKKDVYFMSKWAKRFVRTKGLEKSIDNRRLFLMKSVRRAAKLATLNVTHSNSCPERKR